MAATSRSCSGLGRARRRTPSRFSACRPGNCNAVFAVLHALGRRARSRRDRTGDETPACYEISQLVRLATRAQACCRGQESQDRDQPAERRSEHLGAGQIRDGCRCQKRHSDHIREPRRSGVLERPFPPDGLDELEVRETGEAVPATEGQPDDELEREQREQQPPTGQDREGRQRTHDELIEAWRPRVDDIDVAVWIRESWGCSLHFVKY